MPFTEHRFNNAAYSNIIADINATALTIALVPGGIHAFLPGWAASKYLYLTLVDASANREVVKVTAIAGDNLTIERGQDGTVARSWPAGTLVTQRVVAANLTGMIQKTAFRSITVNPNGLYTAAYPGEKIYQSGPAAGERRWWMSTTGIKWRLIAGALYGTESWDADGYPVHGSEYLVPNLDPDDISNWDKVGAGPASCWPYINTGIITGAPDFSTGIKTDNAAGTPSIWKLSAAGFGVQIVESRLYATGGAARTLGVSLYTGATLLTAEHVIGAGGDQPWVGFPPPAGPVYSIIWILASQLTLAESQDLGIGLRAITTAGESSFITIYEVELQVD